MSLAETSPFSLSVEGGSEGCAARGLLSAIDAGRIAAGLTKRALCKSAGVDSSYYTQLLKGLYRPSAKILRRLQAALAKPEHTAASALRERLIEMAYCAALEPLAAFYRTSPAAARATVLGARRSGDAKWLAANRAHQGAMALCQYATGLAQADLARHFGLSRSGFFQAAAAVEARRQASAEFEAVCAAIEGRLRA